MLRPAAMRRHAMRKRLAFWAAEREHLRSAAFLHATSSVEERELSGLGPAVVSIANGVTPLSPTADDIARIRQRAGLEAEDEVVTFLGRLHPIKRLDLLADAFALVRQERPRAHLVIAAPDDDFRRTIQPLFSQVESAVRWIGAVDGVAKWALLAGSRALVQCSDSESFGMSVAEALTAGVPVVVTDRSPWSAVNTVGCGYWVDHTAAAIARGVITILGRPDACAVGARGREWAKEQFGWNAIGRSMRHAYETVLK
jgi:glycosyltransferase involved in cell wall biosynthesis